MIQYMDLPRHIIENYTNLEYPDISTYTTDSYYLPEHRIDLTHLEVYTIDPSGSTDADDAFSVGPADSSGEWNLYVHIADPTSFFEPGDPLFQCIRKNGVTQYPSLYPARHMFPLDVVEKCSLTDGIRPAITVIHHIKDNKPTGYKCVLSTIQCRTANRYTYEQAGDILSNPKRPTHKLLTSLVNITDIMRDIRNKRHTFTSSPLYQADIHADASGNLNYSHHSTETIKAKRLIEELAIQTNKAVAHMMYNCSRDSFISRECSSLLSPSSMEYTGDFLMDIITNRYTASYTNKVAQHRILNLQTYCHFTSPLRRFSDCITHFCIKNTLIQGNKTELFTAEEMLQFSNDCNKASKKHRNASFMDKKYRMFQYIHQQLSASRPYIPVVFIHSGIKNKRFLNAHIRTIDGYHTNVVYTNVINFDDDVGTIQSLEGKLISVNLHTSNFHGQTRDGGILPDLDMALSGRI